MASAKGLRPAAALWICLLWLPLDAEELRFDLINVLEARPLRLRLFDLSGRLVRQVEALGAAGVQQLQWDGTDVRGVRVPPGIYLLHLEVQGDARRERISRVVQVVY